jgi:hypothetical protein
MFRISFGIGLKRVARAFVIVLLFLLDLATLVLLGGFLTVNLTCSNYRVRVSIVQSMRHVPIGVLPLYR